MGNAASCPSSRDNSESVHLPAGKQQLHNAPYSTVHAADSVSSMSGSHMEAAEQQQAERQHSSGKSLLAVMRDRMATSLVTAGLAPTPELQAAVDAAYAEVTAGAKLKFGDMYRMGHMLGSGHYARVHEATSLQDGTVYAVKVLPKETKKHKAREQLKKVIKEVAVMRLLADHPSAVQLHQVVHDKQSYYLVMEHCSGGELFDYVYKLDHLSEAEAAYYMQQLASFLQHAHDKHITHRDIKPENMLLSPVATCGGEGSSPSWRLKVIDYGCSAFCIPGQRLREAVGTVCYVAPEVLRHDYDIEADLWSAGVVLYMLLSGYLPFDGRNNEETLLLVRTGDYEMEDEDWGRVSQAGQELVRSLLTYKAAGRPTAAQLLQNSWIQQGVAPAAVGKAASTDVSVAATAAGA